MLVVFADILDLGLNVNSKCLYGQGLIFIFNKIRGLIVMYDYGKKQKNIRRAMEFAVDDEHVDAARDLLLQYDSDRMALDLLEYFYTSLPDARNDSVVAIRLLRRAGGVFLLVLETIHSAYLYLVSSEGIEFQGELAAGYLDEELLKHFGFADLDEFKEEVADVASIDVYHPVQADKEVCPACYAASGEVHELGCPVEICPWCGGQLINCPCRFEQLGLEVLSSDAEIKRFEDLLSQKGRIVYSPEQRPDFIDDGTGVVLD